MGNEKNIDLKILNSKGFINYDSFFEKDFIKKINDKCNVIYKAEKLLNKIGFGNRSLRNGSLFIGNLIIKSNLFIELAVNLQKLLRSNKLNKYYLSEYFLVSTNKSKDFSEWWHRDHPHDDENYNLYTNHSIGFFIPVSKYNHSTGATRIIEFSNQDIELSPKKHKSHTLIANKGDLIIYNPKILHTGGSNIENETRHLIILIFNRKELIPCENFEIQAEMIFDKYGKRLIKELNLKRHKPMENFFGRNRSLLDTPLRPAVKIERKIKNKIKEMQSLIYFIWSRLLYLMISSLKKVK